MRQAVTVVLLLVVTASQALADGKMFWREKIPPEIPYQRALILFRDGVETLVLQSKYEVPEASGETEATMGWVVPVPALPEVASTAPVAAYRLFWELGRATRPRVISFERIVTTIVVAVAGVLLVYCMVLLRRERNRTDPPGGRSTRVILLELGIACLLCVVATPVLLLGTLGSAGARGVDVIRAGSVGIYDVQVVRSDNADDLISWLGGNGFRFGEEDSSAFASYIARGWCFVVAVIDPSLDRHSGEIAAEGLAAPLILRFPHEKPVYPLSLTGTGGYETEVLIYLASARKMSAGGRLKLRYAGPMPVEPFWELLSGCEPTDFLAFERSCLAALAEAPNSTDEAKRFCFERMGYPFLCKFRDTLTPAEMAEDLVFTPAEDDTPYREHIVKW
jgi:hypothetical protein